MSYMDGVDSETVTDVKSILGNQWIYQKCSQLRVGSLDEW